MKAESDPTGSPGTFLRRKDREEMLIVPKASSLTRKRSKKEKRKGTPVVKVRYTYSIANVNTVFILTSSAWLVLNLMA